MTQSASITFIGGGNMASSLIGGLIQSGYERDKIRVCDPDKIKLQALSKQYQITCKQDGNELISGSSCIILAVKPQVIKTVVKQLQIKLEKEKPLIISIAAGIKASSINQWLNNSAAIVQAMPNTPALIQTSATALYANSYVSQAQKKLAESLLNAVGITLWLDNETLMDTATGIFGSGPAYFFLIMEAMESTAYKLGLSKEQAHLLTLQTALGSAKMALDSNQSLAALRERVTSKGGTTEQGIKTLKEGNLAVLFETALAAAKNRATELSSILDK